MYVLLLAICMVLFAVCLFSNELDLISPTSILTLAFLVASLLAVVGLSSWNEVPLQLVSVLYLTSGLVAFIAGSQLVKRFFGVRAMGKHAKKTRGALLDKTKWRLDLIPLDSRGFQVKLLLLALIACIACASKYTDILRLGAQLGMGPDEPFPEIARAVRSLTASSKVGVVGFSEGYSVLVRLFDKVVGAVSLLAAILFGQTLPYVFAKRKGAMKVLASSSLLLIATCCYYLIGGGRSSIFRSALAAAISLYLAVIEQRKDVRRVTIGALVIIPTVAVIGAAAFYYMGSLIGRKASSGIIDYVSFYFGSGIPAFQLLVDDIASIGNAGHHVFWGIQSNLFKVGMGVNPGSYSLAWYRLGGFGCNIFTLFGRYFADYGLGGIVLLSALSAVVVETIYQLFKQSRSVGWLVIYALLAVNLFDGVREEYLFSRFFMTGLTSVLIALVMCWLLFYRRRASGSTDTSL